MSVPPVDVVDRLEGLARHAPGGSIDPDAVWSRGRRRRHLRAGTALAVLVAVGLLGATTTPLLIERAQRVEPADTGDRIVLPDVIRQPGGWEPAFPSAPGRLSAVGPGTRSGLWSDRNAWWGVSAATGESRFLDLPDAASGFEAPALSADGRLLAYWATGEVGGSPFGNTVGGEDIRPVVGVAVLHLETGRRELWELESDHGLGTGGMAWAGDVLWWSAGPGVRIEGNRELVALPRLRTWDLRTGARVEVDSVARRRVGDNGVGGAPGGFVEQRGARRVDVVTGGADPTVLRLALPKGMPAAAGTREPAVNTDGSRLAALLMPDASRYGGAPQAVLVGDLMGQEVVMRPVSNSRAETLLGWRSPTEVVVAGLDHVSEGSSERVKRAWSLDVGTGEQVPLLEFSGNLPQFATEVWAAEVVPAPDAPFAPDPRLVGLGLLVGVLVAWRVAVRVRSRRGHP